MNREEAKEELKGHLREYVESITTKSKGKNMYICPLCGSGTGPHHTGAFGIYQGGIKWHCHRCGEDGDLFDLIGKVEGIHDHNEQLKRAGELYGVEISGVSAAAPGYQNPAKIERPTPTHNSIHTSADITDYTQFYIQANKDLSKTSYHRGISMETLNRFMIGYVEAWKHPDRPDTVASPRLIIPTSKNSYAARDTRPNAGGRYLKAGHPEIFNKEALQAAQTPIFIAEGEIDALSIIDVGGEAVGLGSTQMKDRLLDLLEKSRPAQPLIIALDNDEGGEDTGAKLAEGLQALHIPFYRLNYSKEYKDPNEALQGDREGLRQAVAEAIEEADYSRREKERAAQEAYLNTATKFYIKGFKDGIKDSVNTPAIPTGFKALDAILDGGLYEGLYIVGAVSSVGKTTLVMQIADRIAQGGRDVLIFSLEMARTELMARSISRHTYQRARAEGLDTRNAKTARGITAGSRYQHYSQTEKDLINRAIDDYSEYAGNLYINEGIGDIGAAQVRATTEKHIYYTGSTPVIVVDYLQILAPYSDRASDKQNTDKAVLELKRISRDYKTPVIAISSFNRENYKEAVTMKAFKESGAIEYGCDVLIGLQLAGAGAKKFDEEKAKDKNPRAMELVILKNRNGRTRKKGIGYSYNTMFNYFEETDTDAETGAEEADQDGDPGNWSKAISTYNGRRGNLSGYNFDDV